MNSQPPNQTRVVPPRPQEPAPEPRQPLWRDLLGDVLRQERLAQERTLKEVAETARISLPYLSEIERGRKEASSEVLGAAAHALGLDLGALLTLVQTEFTRRQSTPRGRRGLCLAA